MSDWDDIVKPAVAYCDGCGKPIEHGAPTHAEHLKTGLGRCYRRTHDRPECIEASRAAVGGRPAQVKATAQDRVNARLRGL